MKKFSSWSFTNSNSSKHKIISWVIDDEDSLSWRSMKTHHIVLCRDLKSSMSCVWWWVHHDKINEEFFFTISHDHELIIFKNEFIKNKNKILHDVMKDNDWRRSLWRLSTQFSLKSLNLQSVLCDDESMLIKSMKKFSSRSLTHMNSSTTKVNPS